jgi:ankyrin repeat protein
VVLFVALVRQAVPLQGAGESQVAAAAKSGDRAAVRRLITARADVNAPERDGSTALLWAVYNSDVEMAKALIAAGAKVDVANRFGVTPLLQASRVGDVPVIEALLNAGASPTLAHPDGETPLMAVSRAGRVDAVRLLLAKGAGVNTADAIQEQTPLMWAAAEGHLDVVQALLEAGADPKLQAHVTSLSERKHGDHPTGGFTALMWAARNGHADVVEALAKGGADLTQTNGDGATATMIAIANDRFDIAKELIELGADPNDGSLYMAADMHDATTDARMRDGGLLRWDHPNETTSLDLIKLLLEKGADPNKAFVGTLHSYSMGTGDPHNGSAFFRASVAADVEAMKVMIAHGANLEWTPSAPAAGGGRGNPNAGKTPAMVALTGGRGMAFGGGPGFGRLDLPVWREPGDRTPLEALKLLLDAGANPNAEGPDGQTLLHQAVTRKNVDMLKVLVAKGANIDTYNWEGQTVMDLAEAKLEESKDPEEIEKAAVAAAIRAANGQAEDPTGTATPLEVVNTLRVLKGWEPWPDSMGVPRTAEAAKTTASANQGGQ